MKVKKLIVKILLILMLLSTYLIVLPASHSNATEELSIVFNIDSVIGGSRVIRVGETDGRYNAFFTDNRWCSYRTTTC